MVKYKVSFKHNFLLFTLRRCVRLSFSFFTVLLGWWQLSKDFHTLNGAMLKESRGIKGE